MPCHPREEARAAERTREAIHQVHDALPLATSATDGRPPPVHARHRTQLAHPLQHVVFINAPTAATSEVDRRQRDPLHWNWPAAAWRWRAIPPCMASSSSARCTSAFSASSTVSQSRSMILCPPRSGTRFGRGGRQRRRRVVLGHAKERPASSDETAWCQI